jgi:predicted DNA-binding transcriptional regulator AlpA
MEKRKNSPKETNRKSLAERYVSLTDAAEMLTCSTRTVRRNMQRDSTFPRPRRLNARRVVFIESELLDWMLSRPLAGESVEIESDNNPRTYSFG